MLYGLTVLLTILATELGFLQRILGTAELTGDQWLTCIGVGLIVLLVDEVIKIFLRMRRGHAQEPAPALAPMPA
jgi:Ca2+-transporting ATPase